MKKFFLFFALTVLLSTVNAQGFGRYTHFEDTIIVANDTVETAIWIDIAKYPYLGVVCRTTNVVDSTKYIVDYFISYDTTYTYTPSSSSGSSDNSIFVISDSSGVFRAKSIQSPVGRFLKIRIITDLTANDCGDRIHFWLYTYSWKPL